MEYLVKPAGTWVRAPIRAKVSGNWKVTRVYVKQSGIWIPGPVTASCSTSGVYGYLITDVDHSGQAGELLNGIFLNIGYLSEGYGLEVKFQGNLSDSGIYPILYIRVNNSEFRMGTSVSRTFSGGYTRFFYPQSVSDPLLSHMSSFNGQFVQANTRWAPA